jgi:hypothetical protein
MDQFSTETGVRSTPLTQLPYFDPVHNPVLGFMHNWLLGKLQTQLRDIWRLGPKKLFGTDRDDASEAGERSHSARDSDSDIGSSSEYADLSDEGSDTLSITSQPQSLAGLQQVDPLSVHLSSDDEMDDNDSFIPRGCSFTKEQLFIIREFIALVYLPTYIK